MNLSGTTGAARWRARLAAVGALLLGVWLWVAACGGGAQTPVAGDHTGAALGLNLQSVTPTAETLQVTLSATGAAGLHQLSCRIAYDPLAVKPVDAARGTLVDSRAVFFSVPEAAAARASGYVPIAFTYHAGEDMPATGGSIASLNFVVLDRSRNPGLKLIRDPQYLIARDASRHDIAIGLQVRQ